MTSLVNPIPVSNQQGLQPAAAPAAVPAAAGPSKLQDVLHSVLLLGATLGPDFIHSSSATNALGLALAGLEAVIQVIGLKA